MNNIGVRLVINHWYDQCSSPASGKVLLLNGYCWWNSVLKALHCQELSVGYGSNDNRLRIGGIIEWMVCCSDYKYLPQRLLPVIINFLSQSDEDSYYHLHQKNLNIPKIYQYLKLCFAARIVPYHHFCAALYCIATPLLYCNLCCIAEILSLVCVLVVKS